MGRYQYTFGFFDTMQQAEKFKAKILEDHKNNRYYMRKYADKISIGNWTCKDKKDNKIIVHYYW